MTTKKSKKRKYDNDPLSKIRRGEHWELLVKLDHDNGINLLDEIDELGLSKTRNFSALVNKRLKQSFHEHPVKRA